MGKYRAAFSEWRNLENAMNSTELLEGEKDSRKKQKIMIRGAKNSDIPICHFWPNQHEMMCVIREAMWGIKLNHY